MTRRAAPATGPLRTAANGREAIGILHDEEVDLVLTDLVMPEPEGIEIIQEIRRCFPAVKTVAMSGALFGPYLRAAELLGAHATLSKPLNSSLLRLTLQQVLAVSHASACACPRRLKPPL